MSQRLRLISLSLALLTASHLAAFPLFAKSSQAPAAGARATSFRIDEQAIQMTARQFPTVKRVEICAVGETPIDAQLEKPFPRCAK